MNMVSLPRSPGAYTLSLLLSTPLSLHVGRLGKADFPAGRYFYCGSAMGSGGLNGRLGRYLQGGSQYKHWHMDYFRPESRLEGIYYIIILDEVTRESNNLLSFECRWSQALAALTGAVIPLPGFGASDCRSACKAHLVAFPGTTGESVSVSPHSSQVYILNTLAESAQIPPVKFTFITPPVI